MILLYNLEQAHIKHLTQYCQEILALFENSQDDICLYLIHQFLGHSSVVQSLLVTRMGCELLPMSMLF